MTEQDIGVVIMAGGLGTGFWPIARKNFPKYLLAANNKNQSLIEVTIERACELTKNENIYVIGDTAHEALMKKAIGNIKFIAEPRSCNTALALGLSALHVRKQNKDCIMVALSADQAIWDQEKFCKTIFDAVQIASSYDVLVTIGVVPTYPHTDYGYIRRGERIGQECCDCPAYVVSRFYEKPNLKRARIYFSSEEFFWNSGIYVWRPEVLLQAIREHMPDLYADLMEIDAVLGTPQEKNIVEKVYGRRESISIDFGVMEHAKNCVVVEAEPFGWDDVGAWDAWGEHMPRDDDGNTALGDVMFMESTGCIVHSQKKFTAVVGADDIVVINTNDALLVTTRDKIGDVKKVVAELRKRGRNELL